MVLCSILLFAFLSLYFPRASEGKTVELKYRGDINVYNYSGHTRWSEINMYLRWNTEVEGAERAEGVLQGEKLSDSIVFK